jgi:hypothetical protein
MGAQGLPSISQPVACLKEILQVTDNPGACLKSFVGFYYLVCNSPGSFDNPSECAYLACFGMWASFALVFNDFDDGRSRCVP